MPKPDIQRKLAEIRRTIKTVRVAKGFSQQYLAEQLKTTQNIYSKIERGEMEVSIDRFLMITRILDIDINYLLKDQKSSS